MPGLDINMNEIITVFLTAVMMILIRYTTVASLLACLAFSNSSAHRAVIVAQSVKAKPKMASIGESRRTSIYDQLPELRRG
jgi:hypothetical protein